MTLLGALAGRVPWTPAEDDTLRLSYASGGIKAAQQALPLRSVNGIYHRANEILGPVRRRHWSAQDVTRLRFLWDASHSLPWIAKQLGRTVKTTYQRAQSLGLPLGCPQGYEYLTNAAIRCGYTAGQLRHRLRWAGVPIHPALSRTARGRKRSHVVDPQDVDDALERWHSTEPVEAAARRLGVCGETLKRRALKCGVIAPGGRQHLRITAEQVQQAMALQVVGRRLQPPQGATT
jgi:hypothetical protein